MLFYFLPFLIGCGLLLAAVAWRPRLIYEYPYFMAAAFIGFILPQAYALYATEWGGEFLESTLIMCALCLAACWLGYQPRAHPGLLQKFNVPINTARFFHGGVLFVLVGYYFTYKFASMPLDEDAGLLSGIGTIYLFFGGLVYPGFAICFYCALKGRKLVAWLAAAVAAVVPLQAAIFYGRREPTALFLISLALTLYFLKGKTVPRWLVIGSVVGSIFIIPAVGEYRKLAAEDPLEALKQIDFGGEVKGYFDEDAISEVKNATILIAATQQTDDYEWGAGYWNRIVFRFVPAQFLGKEFKDSLMIGDGQRDLAEYVEDTVGVKTAVGSTFTGLGDSFNQFGYFGCLFFAAMAYLFKNLWTAANTEGGTVAQILYIQITTSAMRALTHQTMDFLPGLIYSGVFIGLVAMYARDHRTTGRQDRRTTGPKGGGPQSGRTTGPGRGTAGPQDHETMGPTQLL